MPWKSIKGRSLPQSLLLMKKKGLRSEAHLSQWEIDINQLAESPVKKKEEVSVLLLPQQLGTQEQLHKLGILVTGQIPWSGRLEQDSQLNAELSVTSPGRNKRTGTVLGKSLVLYKAYHFLDSSWATYLYAKWAV